MFYHNFTSKRSVASLIYQLLSFCDFVTNLYLPVYLGYQILYPVKVGSIKEKDRIEANAFYGISSFLMWGVMYTSPMLTTLLSLTRYIAIKFPFKAHLIKQWYIVLYVTLFVLMMELINIFCFKPFDNAEWFPLQQMISSVKIKNSIRLWTLVPLFVHCALTLVISILTMIELAKSSPQLDIQSNRKGIVGILMMNLGCILWFILCILDFSVSSEIKLYFVIQPCFTYILSSLNPVIVVSCGSRIKRRIKSGLFFEKKTGRETFVMKTDAGRVASRVTKDTPFSDSPITGRITYSNINNNPIASRSIIHSIANNSPVVARSIPDDM